MQQNEIAHFLAEDGLTQNDFYLLSLPRHPVACQLKFKSAGTFIAGLPTFFEVFRTLLLWQHDQTFLPAEELQRLLSYEGTYQKNPITLTFTLPFNVVLNGERLALNLLQRASSVASLTYQFVEKVQKYHSAHSANSTKKIAVLDTRKTTPGLRSLEKYAVRVAGGHNHRFSQTDMFMIKDNHKQFFGGLTAAYNYFQSIGHFYAPIISEIHQLEELEEAKNLPELRHFLLDNFSADQIKQAIQRKLPSWTYEISGGIRLNNVDDYLMEGVDAFSIGNLTYNPTPIDISLKFGKS